MGVEPYQLYQGLLHRSGNSGAGAVARTGEPAASGIVVLWGRRAGKRCRAYCGWESGWVCYAGGTIVVSARCFGHGIFKQGTSKRRHCGAVERRQRGRRGVCRHAGSLRLKKYFSVGEIPLKLNGAIGRFTLALQKRAQQTCEAATIVGVHGGKLDGHALAGGHAADDTTRADLTSSGG